MPYSKQVVAKERQVREVLGSADDGLSWLPSVISAEAGFRNKAKMVVTGTAAVPVLGLGTGVDLTECPLYPAAIREAFGPIKEFITRAQVQPYDLSPAAGRVTARAAAGRGELKHVLVTASPDRELLVRLVLRSQEPLDRLRKHLPWLQERLPSLAVLSVNIQPEHKAV
ncbi:MAG: 23S rRNA (uracil(747)-C(5))-methyltransferase, partial [Promicromonosporaceae bacterium]|nr:23S rRNA (uracil(747)-C(5))-methyltransferase [Promicromonosporaceae bacterium]